MRLVTSDPYEVPRPVVVGVCRVCARVLTEGNLPTFRIVSPQGLEHLGLGNGDTWCGKDATGAAWWWPL